MEREIEILKKENVTKTTQLHKLKCETSQTISDLKDDIVKLQQEKSALSSELSKESEKGYQLSELRCEKSKITGALEDHITRLRRENRTLTARISKAYDQLTELREKVQLLENQLKNVTEAATVSVNSKEKEMEEDYRIIKKQDETIKSLIEEIRQERCDKYRLELQSERIRELETQLQRMEDMKRKTIHSVDALVLEVKQERSEKDLLRKRAMEAEEVGSYREKELEKRIELLENHLHEKDEMTNVTLASLKNDESSLQEAKATIDMLTEQLEREKSEKEALKRAVEVFECNSQNEKRLTEDIEKLGKQLKEMNDLREETLISLKEKEWSLHEAHDEINELTQQIAHKKSNKKFFKWKVKARKGKAYRLNLIQKGTKRYTQERGSFIAGVGKRLKNLVQRPRGVSASSLVMKKKEAYAERVLDKLRDDLNERGEVIQDLRSNFKDTAEELSSMRRQLEDIQCQNAELIRCLGNKEEDLQKTQRYLKENEASLDDANETLRLKCTLLKTMEAKLCLTKKEIEELTQVNKEKGLEITRFETTLTEMKKELDIAASIIEKQNERCANLRTYAMRKTRDAGKMQDELKRFSTQLENSRDENANLHRALLAATARLTREKHRQFSGTELPKDGHERKSSESSCEESTSSILKARRHIDAYKITFLEDESNVAATSQGDAENKWLYTSRLDEHQFETRGDQHFNGASTIAEVDHTMQNFSTHGAPNSVSTLLCNG
ncbi:testis-specific gene 10 protein-like [Pocillopora damicornis]|uniref:testis-specific gene 10 protein-like n=1 Tax=Pocillopora damicornis TaxID=46731 RepID=UPI000F558864|nr:testis-specific gene 10 protein-like [Pocillopora damicornis]